MCQATLHQQHVSRYMETLNCIDEDILDLLKCRGMSIEHVIADTNAVENEAVASISKLISRGFLQLVIEQYPWGVEFELQENIVRHDSIHKLATLTK